VNATAAAPRQRGFALLLVMWAVMILGVIAAAMLAGSKASQRQAYDGVDTLRRAAIEDAALTRAVAGAFTSVRGAKKPGGDNLAEPVKPHWRRDGTPETIRFDGHVATITIQDETGKVDINIASKDTLTALLKTTDLSGADIEDLTKHIIDWRSAPALSAKDNITPVDYAGLGYAYHSRHGPFQTIDELRLVDGMTAEVYDQIAPGITVYSGRKDIDPATAPLAALMSLPGLDRQKAIDVIAGRDKGIPYSPPPGQTSIGSTASPGASAGGASAPAPAAPPGGVADGGIIGHALSITTVIELDRGREAIRRSVVRVTGPDYPVYVILRDEERVQRRS
jgi:general secretion pathway protein K